ncbi:hypothetical protein ACMT1E_05695 [Sphingomonas flavalba]|uniref:hypothetical protein n=1 Tax=Sphingomonas flavalba TaxID=2559804 RepID=UPI0039E0FE41
MELAAWGSVLLPEWKGARGAMRDEEIHRSKTEARAGITPHVVRYILLISLALAVLAMIVAALVN